MSELMEWTTSIGVRSRRADSKWDQLTQKDASMKKLTAILLTACVMSVAFIGCDSGTTTSKEKKTTETKTTTPDPTKTK
jgi:hypothetical protein